MTLFEFFFLGILSSFAAEKSTTVWDEWYIVRSGDIVTAYLNEKVTKKGDKVRVQSKVWKNEDGYINEEFIGAESIDDKVLTPVAFNLFSRYRRNETKIDGTVKDGVLNVSAIKDGKSRPPVKKSIPPKTFLSVFFSYWIGKHSKEFAEKQTILFGSIMEDNIPLNFEPVRGKLWKVARDEYAKKTNSYLYEVNYNGLDSKWWVNENGLAEKIVMPVPKITVERSTKEAAEKAFKEVFSSLKNASR